MGIRQQYILKNPVVQRKSADERWPDFFCAATGVKRQTVLNL